MDYTVKAGDSLSIIARDILGDLSLWSQIAELNKITNPDLIYAGQKIKLPDLENKKSSLVPALTIISLAIVGGIIWFTSTHSNELETTGNSKKINAKGLSLKKITKRLRFGRGPKKTIQHEK